MILTHLESKDGKTLVRLPDGSTRWCDVHELIELAKSDKPAPVATEEDPKVAEEAPKRKYNRKQK